MKGVYSIYIALGCHDISFYRHPRLARLPPCNLAESPLQNGPYQRNHAHSLQQSDATHQKSKDIQCREATAWV